MRHANINSQVQRSQDALHFIHPSVIRIAAFNLEYWRYENFVAVISSFSFLVTVKKLPKLELKNL